MSLLSFFMTYILKVQIAESEEIFMKKNDLVVAGMLGILLLTGCSSNSSTAETEALKEQIAQLEQQVQSLEEAAVSEGAITAGDDAQPDADANATDDAQTPPEDTAGDTSKTETAESGTPSTTRTMEELTGLVDAYVEKAGAASPGGTDTENMESFFNLKQEEKEIDHALDLHEDELEYLYRQDSLTRDEYRKLERELEQLEDRLDQAEDDLEYLFGIDD